jgi:hypothetical protein
MTRAQDAIIRNAVAAWDHVVSFPEGSPVVGDCARQTQPSVPPGAW